MTEGTSRASRVHVGLSVLGFLGLATTFAWTCDDALITFRVVENASAGLGWVWNPDERVQVFSNPLWFLTLLCARMFSSSIWGTSIGLSLLCMAAGLRILLGELARRRDTVALTLAALIGSKASIEFATGGLENPMTHLLLAVWAWTCIRGRVEVAATVAGLLVVNRLDALALVAPWLALAVWNGGPRWWRIGVLGAFAPLVWLGFATFYYGSPWPNPLIAKAFHGGERQEYVRLGLAYLWECARRDPGTALGLLGALAVALRPGSHPLSRAWALGAVLSITAVVVVGGDFMLGRFLTAPHWLALLAAAPALDARPLPKRVVFVAGITLLAMAWIPADAPLRQGPTPVRVGEDPGGIADERTYWAGGSSLVAVCGGTASAPTVHLDSQPGAPPIQYESTAGAAGASAGRSVHVVDDLAITDPFLARLPYRPVHWRPGHVHRPLPAGYDRTLRSGVAQFEDPAFTACWNRVAFATRAPLLAPGRGAAIYALLRRGCDDYWAGRTLQEDGTLR